MSESRLLSSRTVGRRSPEENNPAVAMSRVNPSNTKLKLALPSDEVPIGRFLTQSGTFKDGDLLVNKDGLRIVSHGPEGEPPLIKPADNQLSLADMDTVKVIGKGSGGIVQLVRHKWTEQFFALKVIQMNIEEAARKQIAQELKINLSSHSPYVVVFYQCFYDNGLISIVLEYMDGGSLANFLAKVESIPEPYLAAICKQPERISGDKHGYLSDIWSLGLVMLECATGYFPYPSSESFYELLEAVVEHPPPCAPPDKFSAEFCSFISACIQKNPKDRQSAQVLLKHPFLSLYSNLNVDLASYITTAGCPLATF